MPISGSAGSVERFRSRRQCSTETGRSWRKLKVLHIRSILSVARAAPVGQIPQLAVPVSRCAPPWVLLTLDPRGLSRDLRGRLRYLFDTETHKRQPLLQLRLSRGEGTVLARLSSTSALTNKWRLFYRCLAGFPSGLTYGEDETISRVLFYCTLDQQARVNCGRTSVDGSTPEEIWQCTLFSSGTIGASVARGRMHCTDISI